MKVLVTAASKDGATYEIGEALARVLRERRFDTTVSAPEQVHDIDGYDAFVVGSAVYMGRWLEPATDFVSRFAAPLSVRPVWLFSSGPVGDPRRTLVQKMGADPIELPSLLAQTKASGHHMFAGKLVSEHATLAQRVSLRVFRGFEGDFRDWAEIERWAIEIADALAGPDCAGRVANEATIVGAPR